MTAAERAQQARVAENLRRETLAMATGAALPPKHRRRQRKDGDGRVASISAADSAQLRVFLGTHGAAIAAVLALAQSENDELEIASAYRSIVEGKPGAHEAWGRLVRRVSMQ